MDARLEAAPLRGCWTLDRFVLDLDRAELTGVDGAPVPLRPKAFALLEHLVRQAGRVVSREALLDAVWPSVTVTDESLSQAVAELRQALGDAGRRLIRTVPRRGYVLDATPSPAVPHRPCGMDAAAPVSAAAGTAVTTGPKGARPARLGSLPRPATLSLAGALCVLAVAGVASMWLRPGRPAPPTATAERLTREGTRLAYPALGTASDHLAARALHERAIAADPRYAPAFAAAAFSHTAMVLNGASLDPAEDTRRATALAERATQLAPTHPMTLAARGEVLRVQGRYEEALAAHRASVAGDPGLRGPRAISGWLLVLLGRPAEAIGPLRTALALAGDDDFRAGMWSAHLGLAKLFAGVGDLGVEALQRSLRTASGQHRDTRQLHLAAALALSDRVEEARGVAADALARSPHLTTAWVRDRPFSQHPDHLAQREAVFRGLALAGVP